MHPILARYLTLEHAVDTLHREELGQVLRAEERWYAQAAQAFPERRAALLAARGRKAPPPEVQEALVIVGAHAAAAALREDPELAPKLARAWAALMAEGASEAEASHLVATVLLEEAFGYDEGVEGFDRAFVGETLETIPELAALTRERVAQLSSEFVRGAAPDWRFAHELAAQCLIEAAWGEGPEPVNPEHVQEALARAEERISAPERPRARVALKRFLAALAHARLIGEQRLVRLGAAIDAADRGPPEQEPN